MIIVLGTVTIGDVTSLLLLQGSVVMDVRILNTEGIGPITLPPLTKEQAEHFKTLADSKVVLIKDLDLGFDF